MRRVGSTNRIRTPEECKTFLLEKERQILEVEDAWFLEALDSCLKLVYEEFAGSPIKVPLIVKNPYSGRLNIWSFSDYERDSKVLETVLHILRQNFIEAGWGDTFDLNIKGKTWPFNPKVVITKRRSK